MREHNGMWLICEKVVLDRHMNETGAMSKTRVIRSWHR